MIRILDESRTPVLRHYQNPLENSPRKNPWSKMPTYMLALGTPGAAQARLYHGGRSAGPSNPTNHQKDQEDFEAALPTASDTDLPHLTPSQNVHMTQINEKPIIHRQATARGLVYFSNNRPWELLREGQGTHKGDVFSVARIAGIMGAKRTPDVVPLCHPGIGITGVEVDVKLLEPVDRNMTKDGGTMRYGAMRVTATVRCQGRTGVEMEAMTATMGAALTVYDMLKAVDKGMTIGGVQLWEKKGGKSGHWRREE